MKLSQASTYYSEHECLTTLHPEEKSPLRRSQRLRESKLPVKDVEAVPIGRRTSSPQLFEELDDEYSQLAQIAPNDGSKLAISNSVEVETKRADVKKPCRRKRTSSSPIKERPKKSLRGGQITKTNSAPMTVKLPLGPEYTVSSESNSQLHQSTMSANPGETILPSSIKKPCRRRRSSSTSARGRKRLKSVQSEQKVPKSNSDSLEVKLSYEPQYALSTKNNAQQKQYTISVNPKEVGLQPNTKKPCLQTKQICKVRSRRSTHNMEPQPESQPIIRAPYANYNKGESDVFTGSPLHKREEQPLSKGSSLITNSTQMYSYRQSAMNLTQTLLPERYPAHFIYQLPSEPKHIPGINLPGERQCTKSATTSNTVPRKQLTPTTCCESYTPSPPNPESLCSSTPSLSESLAEVFGTRKLREVLNISAPHQYRVQDFQLPAIAVMLGVEVGRLRDALDLTERLSQNQVHQLRHGSPDCSSDPV